MFEPFYSFHFYLLETRYKIASGNDGDKQQLQWLYSACKGNLQVVPSPTVLDTQTSSAANAHQTVAESPERNNNWCSGAVDANGWEISTNAESYNGWGPTDGREHSELGNTGWMGGPTRKDYNGWGVLDSGPSVQTLGDHSGWMDARTKKENDWDVPDSRPTGKQSHQVQSLLDPPAHVQTSGLNASMSPSAPPIPDDVLVEEPSQYPSIDFNPVHLPATTTTDHGASTTNDAKGDGSSSCIICWEAPVEGACIPCGHMAGCMSCLNEIKAKNGLCPVCRSKIDKVIRLYTV